MSKQKKDIKEKPPDNKEYFKCVKVPLQYIIKHDDSVDRINNAVIKMNKVVIHTLQFMKLYLLDYYAKNNKLPNIDKVFVNSCLKTVCCENEAGNGRPPSEKIKKQREELKKFYNKNYKKLTTDKLDYQHLNTVLDYLTIDIITMYENNIKLHYVEYLERYVNVMWKKKLMIDKIRKLKKTKKERDEGVNNLCRELRKIKDDILNTSDENYKSKAFYHKWINEIKTKIIPSKQFKKDSLYYDIQCDPQDYYPCMIHMMKEIEKQNEKINNVFPLRTEVQPKHIRLDTTTIIHLLFNGKQGKPKTFFLTKGNTVKYEDKLWKYFFRTERKCFKKPNYTFHHMIETDGVSASILLLRKDMVGKRIPISKNTNNEKYIDELDNYDVLKDKKIVAYDPNAGDLIYCVDGTDKDRTQFRYTQDTRRKECKIKKYRNIITENKQEKIKGKTIIEWETEISKFNRKTLDVKEFKKYIKKKNEVNTIIFKFYENKLYRKLKLNGYINKKKNEQRMINNFKNKFGSPENVVIIAGDWEQKKGMSYGKEPTKGKGIRTIFRRVKYNVFLADEFRTSCRCSKCGEVCETFRKCDNPKPWKDNVIIRHGAVSCKNCHTLWNRDENSSSNIFKIAYNAINGLERPKYLCRNKNKDDNKKVRNLSVVLRRHPHNQNLHEDEKPQQRNI